MICLHFSLPVVISATTLMSIFMIFISSFILSTHVFGCLPLFLIPLMLQRNTLVGNLLTCILSHVWTILISLNLVIYCFCLLESTSNIFVPELRLLAIFSAMTFLQRLSFLVPPSSISSIYIQTRTHAFTIVGVETFLDFQILPSFPIIAEANHTLHFMSCLQSLHSPSSVAIFIIQCTNVTSVCLSVLHIHT